jgi:FkbM family methyltransferase
MIKTIAKNLLPSWLWGKLYAWRSGYNINQFQPREVSHNYGVLSLKVHLADPLAAGWYDRDWDELTEIALLSKGRLKKGARVFDLGAHQGVVALMLAERVGAEGKVVALEANPHNAAVARRNCQLNGVGQVEIVHAAVAEKSGQVTFNQGLNGQMDDGSGSFGQITVEAYAVDALAQKYGVPDVLFIDVEGYECRVLQGARATLANGPDCFIEVHVGAGLEKFGGSVAEMVAFFPADKYQLFMANDTQREFVPFDAGSALVKERFFLVALNSLPALTRQA